MRNRGSVLQTARWYLVGDWGDSRPRDALRYVLLAAVLAAAAWLLYFAGATLLMPYPLEFREGAAQVLTKFLLEGTNPFSFAAQPLALNGYGIVYYAVVWPFAAAFGNTLLVHRVISTGFVVLSAALVLQTVHDSHSNTLLAVACGELLAMALAARAGLGAFPSAAGTLFFLAAIIIPFRRSFDLAGLAMSAAFFLLAFYTKTYFALCFGIVASYVFIFVSMRRALLYGLISTVAFGVSFLAVRSLFPFYYFDVAIINVSHALMLASWATYQLQILAQEFYPLLIVAVVLLLQVIPGLRPPSTQAIKPTGDRRPAGLDRPLLSRPAVNYFIYGVLCATLVFMLVLGPSRGAYMVYEYQLMFPLFLIWLGREVKAASRLNMLVVPLLIFNLFTFADKRLNPVVLNQRDSTDWARLYEILDRAHAVLNSPVLVSEMIRLNMPVVDSGQTEYYYNVSSGDYPGGTLLGPSFDLIQSNGQVYLDSIRTTITQGKYDAIMITENWGLTEDLDLIRQHYRLTDQIKVPMPQRGQEWTVDVWVPIQP